MESLRKFSSKDIVGIIQDLEFIRINLTRISKLSVANDNELEKRALIESLFLIDKEVQERFTNVWRTLVDNFKGGEEDDLDDQLDAIDHWAIPMVPSKEDLLKMWRSKQLT